MKLKEMIQKELNTVTNRMYKNDHEIARMSAENTILSSSKFALEEMLKLAEKEEDNYKAKSIASRKDV